MNKIYKVIWSKVKNCWTVVSELAKSHTKGPNSGVVSKMSLEKKVNLYLLQGRDGIITISSLDTGFVAVPSVVGGISDKVEKPFKITVAAIVKNEAENVPTWVQAARSCADEIVVVDTGSTDGTLERFADYGIKCFHYDWNDDFASAKNYMISLCHGDWIVLLDGDEWFREGCDVRKAIAKHHRNPITKAIIADWICLDKDRNNAVMFSGGAVRAFRNQPDVRYFRKVHENLTINYENFAFEPDFKMYHTGYSGSVNRSKHERNLRIMRTMFDFDNGKVEYPTDWRYIEDTYAGLGDYPKALWAADNMISFGVQEYSAAAWITKFNVLFAMKTPLAEMRKQFDFCFRTVPSVSGFRFLASIYYVRNGLVAEGLDNYIEGLRMLMGPQDKVAMEHTYWRMYMPEASALASAVYLQNKQVEASLYACKVCEQYCGQTDWTNRALADVRRVLNQTEESLLGNISERALPVLQFGKKAVLATTLVSSLTIGMVGVANPVFAACCNLNEVASNSTTGNNSTVTGGYSNTVSGCNSSISGGCCNTVTNEGGSISGGYCNFVGLLYSYNSGGKQNFITPDTPGIVGGSIYQYNGSNYFLTTYRGSFASISGGQCNIAIGCYSSVSGGICNTAAGEGSSISGGKCNYALGLDAWVGGGTCGQAYACYSSVIGGGITGVWNCTWTAHHSVAIGQYATTTRDYEVAIGSACAPVKIGGNLTVTGTNTVTDGTTTKTWTELLNASGGGSASIPNFVINSTGNSITATGTDAVALGYNAKATGSNTVAIGSQSITNGDNVVSFGHDAYTTAPDSTLYTSALYRKLINVADGTDAHDVATVGQVGSLVQTNMNSILNSDSISLACSTGAEYYSIAIGACSNAGGKTSDELGNNIVIGHCATATLGEYRFTPYEAIAIGHNSLAQSNSVVLGSAASSYDGGVAIGRCSYVAYGCSIAIGMCSTAMTDDVVSFGHKAGDSYRDLNDGSVVTHNYSLTRRLINISDGIDDSDAVTVGQLNTALANVGGGGSPCFANGVVLAGCNNTASGCYSSVSGGCGNVAGIWKSYIDSNGNTVYVSLNDERINGNIITVDDVEYSLTSYSGNYATISGGCCNLAIGNYSSVIGGRCNIASGNCSVVVGGTCNLSSGSGSSVSAGNCNISSGSGSSVSGGSYNRATAEGSSVSGGWRNIANCSFASVSGGSYNTASGNCSLVSGGAYNTACNYYSFVAGGSYNIASGYYSSIIGGYCNKANSQLSFVGGGSENIASGCAASVIGGLHNTASGSCSLATGGAYNLASGVYSSIIGGCNSRAYAEYSTSIGGGITGVSTCSKTALGSVAIGKNATSTCDYEIAIGSSCAPVKIDGALTVDGAKNITDGTTTKTWAEVLEGGSLPNTLALGTCGTTAACASGTNSISIGEGAVASGDKAISIGTGNQVRGDNSGAIGDPNIVDAHNSYTVGNNSTISANVDGAFVFGNNVTVNNGTLPANWNSLTDEEKSNLTGEGVVALGNNVSVSLCNKVNSSRSSGSTGSPKIQHVVAIGECAIVGEENAMALGYEAKARALNAFAGGSNASALSEGATTLGHNATVHENSSFAIAVGYEAEATGEGANAFGDNANAGDKFAVAFGRATNAQCEASTAIGNEAVTTGKRAVAIGNESVASAEGATSIGNSSNAVTRNAVSIGNQAVANGEGVGVVAIGNGAQVGTADSGKGSSTAVGALANVQSYYSTALGAQTSVTANNSVALGAGSVASQANVVSVGAGTATDPYPATRKIINVTDGTANTDVSTVGQTGRNLALSGSTLSLKNANGTVLDSVTLPSAPTYTAGNGLELDTNNEFTVKAGTNVTVDANGVNVVGNGTVASGNTGLISGGTLHSEVRPASNGNYITTTGTTGSNLTALDTQLKTTTDNLATEITNRTNADTALGTRIDNVITAYESADTSLSNRIGSLSVDGNYIKKSATNNVSANLTALDTQLKTTTTAVDTETTNRTNADTALSNRIGSVASDGTFIKKSATNDVATNLTALDTAAKNAIKGLSVSGQTITYTKGDGTTGTITTQDNNTTYTAGCGLTLTGTEFSAKAGTNVTVDANGINVVGNGSVASGNTGLISGSTLYSEARPTANGNYITTANKVGANLTALDTAVKNADNSAIKNITSSGTTVTFTKGDGTTGTFSTQDNDTTYDNMTASELSTGTCTIARSISAKVVSDYVKGEVSTETTARTNADTDLGNRIGTISADGNYIKKSDTKNIAENLGLLDTQVKANATAISNEVTNRTTAVTNEATARESADTALGTRIDGTITDLTVNGQTITYKKGDGTTGTITTQDNNTQYTAGNGMTLTGTEFSAKAGTNITVNANGISVVGNGTVADGNTGLVSGGTLFTEGRVSADGNYVRANNTVAGNLTALDNAVKDNADAITQINTDLAGKANTSLNNITNDGKSVIKTNAKEAINVIGSGKATVDKTDVSGVDTYTVGVTVDGAVAEGNTGIVDGGTVYNALKAQETATNTALTGKANVALDNITETGHNVIKSDAKVAVNAVAGTHTTISKTDVDGVDTYAVNVTTDGAVANGNTGIVTGGTVYTAVNNEKTARETADTTLQGNIDAEVTARQSADTTLQESITAEQTARTTADTALSDRIGTLSADGNYIRQANNVSQNLLTLDDQVKANADAIIANQTKYFGVNAQFEDWTDENAEALKTKYNVQTKEEYEALIANGLNIHGEGAIGIDSIAIGKGAQAIGNCSFVFGNSSTAISANGIAIGNSTTAIGNSSLAIGNGSTSSCANSIAIGVGSSSNNTNSIAIGVASQANNLNAVSIGTGTNVSANNAVAIGLGSLVNGEHGVSIGNGSHAVELNGVALGHDAYANDRQSIAIGYKSSSSGSYSIALGTEAITSSSAASSIAIGDCSSVLYSNSVAIGKCATAYCASSVSLGHGALSNCSMSTALGASTQANCNYSTAVGYSTRANASESTVVGSSSSANSMYSVAVGNNVNSTGENSIALGSFGYTNSNNAVSLGSFSVADSTDAVVSVGHKQGDVRNLSSSTTYDSNFTRRIINVSDGIDDSDVATVGQLRSQKVEYVGINAVWKDWADLTDDEKTALGVTTEAEYDAIVAGSNRNGEGAIGNNSIAIGKNATSGYIDSTYNSVTGSDTIAIGTNAYSKFDNSISVGKDATALGYTDIAIGRQSSAAGGNSVAIGDSTKTTEFAGVAIGYKSEAGYDAIAIGDQAKTTQPEGIAIGMYSTAGSTSVSIGKYAVADTGSLSVAVGPYAEAQGDTSVAVGYLAKTSKESSGSSTAVGTHAEATGSNASAFGPYAKATANQSLALSQYSEASGSFSSAVGYLAKATGESALAVGHHSEATADKTVVVGGSAVADKSQNTAVGFASSAKGDYSMAFGSSSSATGNYSSALGYLASVQKQFGTALGTYASVGGEYSTALGSSSATNADDTTTVGYGSGARAKGATALGKYAGANAEDSLALGRESTAYGKNSIALGVSSLATEENVVSLGKDAVGTVGQDGYVPEYTRRIQHVTAGVNDTDAVNVKQLNDSQSKYYGVNPVFDEWTDSNALDLQAKFGVASKEEYENLIANGLNLHGEGSVGKNTVAIGVGVSTSGIGSVAVGHNIKQPQYYSTSIAVGDDINATGFDSIAIGSCINTSGNNSIAMGRYVSDTGDSNIAIGQHISVDGDLSVALGGVITQADDDPSEFFFDNTAIGHGASVHYGYKNTALGFGAEAGGSFSTSVGSDAEATGYGSFAGGYTSIADNTLAVSIGYFTQSYGDYSTAVGPIAFAGQKGVALGYLAMADCSSQAVALGARAQAEGYNSVALGTYSKALEDNVVSVGNPAYSDTTYDYNISQHVTVDVPANKRRITYVADGINDFDAATVGQLNSQKVEFVGVNTDLPEWTDETKDAIMAKYNVNSEEAYNTLKMISNNRGQGADGDNAIAVGYRAGSHSVSSTAIGTCSLATSQNSIALGTSASAGANSDLTGDIGYNSIAIGYQSESRNHDALAIGSCSATYGAESVALGYGTMATNTNAVAIGSCSVNSHGVQSVAIGSCISATADKSIVIGSCGNAYGVSSVAIGDKAGARSVNSVAVGSCSEAISVDSIALGSNSKAYNTNAVSLGNGLYSAGQSSVAIGSNDIVVEEGQTVPMKGAMSTGSVAIGRNVFAAEENAMAIGTNANVIGTNNIAIGADTDVSTTSTSNSVALGSKSVATVSDVLSLGKDAVGTVGNADYVPEYTRTIQHVTAGVNDTDAVNVKQLNDSHINYVGINSKWTEWNQYSSDWIKEVYNVNSEEEYEQLKASGANKDGSGATSINSISIGHGAVTGINDSSVGGYDGTGAIAIGNASKAYAGESIAIGDNARAMVSSSSHAVGGIALGADSLVTDTDGIAIGRNTQTFGYQSVAIGSGTSATGPMSVSIGPETKSYGYYSIAIGSSATTGSADTPANDSKWAIAIGQDSHAKGENAAVFGTYSKADGYGTTSVGYHTEAEGFMASAAFGAKTKGNYSLAMGSSVSNESKEATVIGAYSDVTENADSSVVVGYDARSESVQGSAFGVYAGVYQKALYSTAVGFASKAGTFIGPSDNPDDFEEIRYASAFGASAYASGNESTSIGYSTHANADASTVLGHSSTVNGTGSIAVGRGLTVNGSYSGAFGDPTIVNGDNSYSVGNNNTIAENTSDVFALGNSINTTASDVVVLGKESAGSETGTISIGHKATDLDVNGQAYGTALNRKIVNVAAGVNDTDAVNVSQLTTGLDEKANVALDNISDAGKTVIQNATNVVSGDSVITVTPTTENGVKTYTVTANISPDGQIAEGNTGLVSGGTVYSEVRPSQDGNYITTTNTTGANLIALDTQVKANTDAITTNTSDISNLKDLSNITEAGQNVIKELSKGSVNVVGTDKATVAKSDVNGVDTYTVSVKADGQVAQGNENIVSGSTVYDALSTTKQEIATDLAGKANVALDNVTDAGHTVIKTDAKSAINVLGGTYATVDKTDVNGVDTYTVNVATDGAVADGNTKLVTGGTVYSALQSQNTEIQTALDGKANVGLDNVTDAGKSVVRTLAQESVKVVNGSNTTVTEGTDGTYKTYAVNTNTDGSVVSGDTGIVTGGAVYDAIQNAISGSEAGTASDLSGKANIALDNITDTGHDVIKTDAKSVISVVGNNDIAVNRTDVSGADTYNLSINKTGAIASNNEGIVTGGTVFSETRPASDGNYIATAKSAGENLTALDTQVKANTDAISNINTGLGDKANTSLDNITNDGETVIKNLAKGSVNVVGEGKATVTKTDVSGVDTYTVSVTADGFVVEGNENIVSGGTVYEAIHGAISTSEAITNTALEGKANVTLDNVTDAGHGVIKSDAKSVINVTGGDYATVEKTNVNGVDTYTINVATDGAVASGNTKLVTGNTVYEAMTAETRPASDGNYISTTNTAGANLTALDSQVKTNADAINTNTSDITNLKDLSNITKAGENVIKELSKGSVNVVGADKATVTKSDVNGVDTYTVSVKADGTVTEGNENIVSGGTVYSALQIQNTEIQNALDIKANKDASNVADYSAEWGSAIGTGAVASGNGELVTGGTVYDALQAETRPAQDGNYIVKDNSAGANLSALDSQVKTNADAIATNTTDISNLKDLSNITEAGETVIKNLSKGSVNVVGTDKAMVTKSDVNGVDTYSVSVKANGEVANGNENLVSGGTVYEALQNQNTEISNTLDIKANIGLDNITDTGKTVVRDLAKESVKVVAGTNTTVTEGIDGTYKTYAVNTKTDGSVASGDTGIVTGGAVYDAIQNAISGSESGTGTALEGKANVSLDNLNNAGNTVLQQSAIASVKVADGENTTVTSETGADGNKTYKIKANATGTVASGNTGLVSGGDVYTAIQNEATIRENTDTALSDRIGIVSADGNYIKASTSKNVSENLGLLDTALKATADSVAGLSTDKANISLDNINTDGQTVIKNLAKDAVKVVAGTKTTVTEGTDGDAKTYAVNVTTDGAVAQDNEGIVTGGTVYNALQQQRLNTQTELVGKANVALDNITTAGHNVIKDDAKSVINVIGDGKASVDKSTVAGVDTYKVSVTANGAVAENNQDIVTGGAVYNAIQNAIAGSETGTGTALEGKANVSLDNLNDAGNTVIQQKAIASVKVADGENTTVTSETDADGNKTYKVKANATGTVTSGNEDIVSGGTVYDAIQSAITTSESETNTALEGKANVDASNVTDAQAWGTKIATGTVAQDDVKAVSGDTMFSELRPADGNYVTQANTTAQNLTALDTQVKANKDTLDTHTTDITNLKDLSNITEAGQNVVKELSKGSVNVVGSDKATVTKSDVSGVDTYTVSVKADGTVTDGNENIVSGGTVYSAIQTAIANSEAGTETALEGKANVDASNVTDATAWGTKIATGIVSDGDVKAVSGETMFTELRPADGIYVRQVNSTAQNLTALDTQVKTNADNIATNTSDITNLKDLSNITESGQNVVKELSKGSVNVVGADKATVTKTDVSGIDTYTVSVKADGTITEGNEGIVSGGTVYSALQTQNTATQTALDNKANVDASNVTDANAWATKLGTGTVSDTDTKLVTGSTVAGETRVASDGNYVLKNNTAGQNISALDVQVKANADNIATNTSDITNLKDLSNITEAGQSVIKELSKGSINVAGTGLANVSKTTNAGVDTYTVSVVADGAIASDDAKAVSGATVYGETRVARDGNYVRAGESANNNLMNLDTALKDVSDAVGQATNGLDGKANVGLDNISTDGQTVIRDLAKGSVKVIAGTSTTVTEGTDGDAKTYAVNVVKDGIVASGNEGVVTGGTVHDAIQDAIATSQADIATALDGKANVDASNVTDSGAWASKLDTGTVSENNAELVSGGKVYTAIKDTRDALETKIGTMASDGNYVLKDNSVSDNLVVLDNQVKSNMDSITTLQNTTNDLTNSLTDKANTSLDNITIDGENVIETLAQGAVKVVNGTNTTVTEGTDNGAKTYAVNVATTGAVASGNEGVVSGGTVYDAIQDAVTTAQTGITDALDNKANKDASNITDVEAWGNKIATGDVVSGDVKAVSGGTVYSAIEAAKTDMGATMDTVLTEYAKKDASNIQVEDWATKLGTGTVASGDNNLVSGSTIAQEVRMSADGNYVRKDNTVAQNFSALDTALKETRDIAEAAAGSGVDENAVHYDGADKSKITLGGASGTTITNLKDGALSVTSTDAVTGKQLYETNQNVQANANNIQSLTDKIGTVQDGAYVSSTNTVGENLNALDNQAKNNRDSIVRLENSVSDLNTNMDSKANTDLSNITNDGKATIRDLAQKSVEATSNDGSIIITKTDADGVGNGRTFDFSVKKDGVVAEGNNDIVTGGAVYQAIQNIETGNANFFGVNNDDVNDLNRKGGGATGQDAMAAGVSAKAEGTDSIAIGHGAQATGEKSLAVGTGNVVTGNRSGAFGDPNNISGDDSYAVGNDNTVSGNNTFVLGNNVTNASGSNTVVLGAGSDGSQDNVVSVGKEGAERKIVHVADGEIAKDSKDAINGGQLFNVQQDLQNAKGIDTGKWTEALGTGKVEEGNTGLVNGDAVYKAVAPLQDSVGLVQYDDASGSISIGANKGGNVINVQNADGEGRVITGVLVDPNDANSATNVGYVNAIGQNIMNATNDALRRADTKANKIGANAAALAALEPPPMDGDEKWAFSAAVGHYEGETAGAVGAFYKPQDNVLINVRGSVGNGEDMIGAGVGFALQRGASTGVTKAKLAKAVNNQAQVIEAMKAEREADKAEIAELKAMVKQLAAQQAEMQKKQAEQK